MPIMAVARFERFFRAAAGIDVDKADLKRYSEFVNEKLHGLLARAATTAQANGHELIQPSDLPITQGLEECMQEFGRLEQELELQAILDRLARRPVLEPALSGETERDLPRIAGGLSVAVARSFRLIEPRLKNPQPEHWERSFAVFNLLL